MSTLKALIAYILTKVSLLKSLQKPPGVVLLQEKSADIRTTTTS